jgi:hypothetical protein
MVDGDCYVVVLCFLCKCRVQYIRGAIVGNCVAFVYVKCLVEILKLFFALAGNAYRMACRYNEDIVVVMLN